MIRLRMVVMSSYCSLHCAFRVPFGLGTGSNLTQDMAQALVQKLPANVGWPVWYFSRELFLNPQASGIVRTLPRPVRVPSC